MPGITDETRSRLVSLVERQPSDLMPGQVPDDLLNETRDALRIAFAELGYAGKFRLSKSPGSSSSVLFWEEARWLLTEGRQRNPDELIRRLEKLVTTNEVVLKRVGVVWGLHPDRLIQLSGELTLLPLTSVCPPSTPNTLLDSSLAHAQQPRPGAAIVHEFVHRPLYFRSSETVAPFTWDDKHFLSDISLVLVLLNDSPVVRVGEWYQVDAQVPVFGTGQSRGGWSLVEPRTTLEIAPQSYDEVLASRLVGGFLRLSPSDRRRMTVAIRRLNLAHLREMPSDVALDLGIALEALLSEADDPPDSMSYRLQTRAAILLGGSIAERDETARQVSQLYGLRSAAAHGEDLDGHWRGQERIKVRKKLYTGNELAETLAKGRRLCGRLARRLLQLGEFPSYRRMMLGEAPPPSDS